MEEVVLYGADVEGEKFYYRYKDRFKIKYVIDKNGNRSFHGAKVYSFEDKKDEIRDELVIIAVGTQETYNEIAAIMENSGLQEFSNFRSADSIDKELAILYGNCHFSVLEQYLRSNPVFNKKYYMRFYYVAERNPYPKKAELDCCKLLISQDIREDNSLHIPGAEELCSGTGKDCIKILVPNLLGCNLFFSQAQDLKIDNNAVLKHMNDEAILNREIKAKEWSVTWISGWRDRNIENIYESGGGVNEIIDMIENGTMYSSQSVLKNFKDQIKKLQKREENCDIKISDYILANYTQRQLFYDPNHPTSDVIMEKGRRILRLLGMEINETNITIKRSKIIDGGELFIYGCVRKALGLQYKQQYIKNNQWEASLYNRPIDLKEYVESYILWHYAE